MNPKTTRLSRSFLGAILFLASAASALAVTRHVANNGVDGPSCGTAANPCRSISRAIANAVAGDAITVGPGLYGDLNDNGTLDETGEETPSPGCGCMLAINKPVILTSTDGAAATVIRAKTVNVVKNVLIITVDAEFGRPEHGFTVTPTGRAGGGTGIVIDGDNIKVRGNQVLGDFVPLGTLETGIFTVDADETVLIEANEVAGWSFGIDVQGPGKTVSKNHVTQSGEATFGVGQFVGNVVVDNLHGIDARGASSVIGNATYGNREEGILVASNFTGVVQKNNIFGNDRQSTGMCGLENNGVVGLDATHNFWGAASGPGLDPADSACIFGAATTITIPFSASRFAINPGFEP